MSLNTVGVLGNHGSLLESGPDPLPAEILDHDGMVARALISGNALVTLAVEEISRG